MSQIRVEHREQESCWEALEGEEVAGRVDYLLTGHVLTFTHTEVPARFGGRGIAGMLAQASLADARARGLLVDPQCSFYARWFDKHPDEKDLLVTGQEPGN
ncbi:GNAT family N-acetyltransferase [Austwickia chelonae]|uniref:GNAT family N-acetyltransferase n=1 Tax=Austwickia chelonae TaxID=100225 RepID=UPI000E239410|nr:GNAT family N-acetyltransferase [Austwickia chelonae]